MLKACSIISSHDPRWPFQVRMVVARPVEPSSSDFQTFGCSAPVVPTKILTDPEELDRQLQQNGYTSFYSYNERNSCDDLDQTDLNSVDTDPATYNSLDVAVNNNNNTNGFSPVSDGHVVIIPADIEYTVPETERFDVELTKNEYGLGITIAGYVCEREDLSGIFVKSLNEGSEAYRCGKININDRIVEVDGQSLQGFTNYEAVEKIKQTSSKVVLTLERYLRGPKFEQLKEALATQEQKDLSPPSPSQTTLSWIPIEAAEVKGRRWSQFSPKSFPSRVRSSPKASRS
jgi:multiple PDZ domain protein